MYRVFFIVIAGFLLTSPMSFMYAQKFEKVTLPFVNPTIRTASFVDLNNDFFPDLTIYSQEEAPSLLLNKQGKDFHYSSLAIDMEEPIKDLVWIDFNNDGSLDLFTLTAKGEAAIYESPQNPYGNAYPFILPEKIKALRSNQWLDIDQNGYLDLYTALQDSHEGLFFKYTSYHGFQKMPILLPLDDASNATLSWADWDENGIEDLLITSKNQEPYFIKREKYQQRQNRIVNSSKRYSKMSISHHWVDFDNDEDLDLFIVNRESNPELFSNNGYGKFKNLSQGLSTPFKHAQKAQWVDIDNDGDLDLIIQSPLSCDKEKFQLVCYYNEDSEFFSKSTIELCGLGSKNISNFLCIDYDLDGKQDLLVITESEKDKGMHLYKNISSQINNWLLIKCIGNTTSPPLSNSQAIGAKVYVKTIQDGEFKTQIRTLQPQLVSGLQGEMILHFGLSNAEQVKSMRIEWPSGRIDYLADLEVNRLYVCRESEKIVVVDRP